MHEEFRALVIELVHACKGNQSEAARRAGVSTALISDTLAGKGPADPKAATVAKLRKAIGRPLEYTMSAPAPAMVRESSGELADKLIKLTIWVREHPHAFPFILNAAKGMGYKEE